MTRGVNGGLAELAVTAIRGLLCPRVGSDFADVALSTRVILALAVALVAIVLGAVGCWLLALVGNCEPAWSVEQPDYRPANGEMCHTCRAYNRTLGLG